MTVAILGRYSPERKAELGDWIERTGATAAFMGQASGLSEAVRSGLEIRVVVLDAGWTDAAKAVEAVRRESVLSAAPILALVDAPTHRAFVDALNLGADDAVVRHDRSSLMQRIALAGRGGPLVRPAVTEGTALIVHADAARRQVLGRTLRHAGFDVAFAASLDELVELDLGARPVEVGVVSEEQVGGRNAASLAELRGRAGRTDLPVVVLTQEGAAGTGSQAVGEKASLVADGQPADHLLFVVNELRRPEIREIRDSPRLLCNTLCAVRRSGEYFGTFGLTYNISADGLFVRTLDAPESGSSVWLEMRPSERSPVVHLRGQVVWARRYGGSGGLSPFGFGVRLAPEECPSADLAEYRRVYEALRAARL